MTDSQKAKIAMYNGLYEEEIEYFDTFPKTKQVELIKATEKQIKQLQPTERKLAEKMGSLFLAIVYCEDLLEDPINEENIQKVYEDRMQYIEEAQRLLEKPEGEEIYNKYGILETYANGEYKLDSIIDQVYEEEGFSIDEKEKERFKNIIQRLWKNQERFPSEEILKEESIKQNGIGFKEFLFCEEYIKQGKITKTALTLGIGRTTCYEYLKKEEVKEYLEKRRKEIKEESDNLLKTGFYDCFSELQNMISSRGYMQDHDRIKAIDTYLRHYEANINKSDE